VVLLAFFKATKERLLAFSDYANLDRPLTCPHLLTVIAENKPRRSPLAAISAATGWLAFVSVIILTLHIPLPQHIQVWVRVLGSLVGVIFIATGFYLRYQHHKTHGQAFPQLEERSIRFRETKASCSSHKTTFTRLGGAKRCLEVTVTDAEVWIRAPFPHNIFALELDLEHRIPRSSIIDVRQHQSRFVNSVWLEYRNVHGATHRLSLLLQKPDDFLRALDLQPKAV
jgi:hypothetical protein